MCCTSHLIAPERKAQWILLILCCLFHINVLAQYTLQGVVRTADGKPIPNASVFFSNTSFGTAANAEGFFVLSNIPAGRYELIVSSIGFETKAVVLTTADFSNTLTINLKPKAEELADVVVGSYERETWEQWGKFFMDNFIGTTPEAMKCTLKNSEAIRFRNYKKRKKLVVVASEPLVIDNYALGYHITFQLEMFEYDFEKKILFYAGYPLFTSMEKNGKEPKEKWIKNRNKSYYGSKMHFMRSLYRNIVESEGFELHYMEQLPNAEKERVKKLYQPTVVSSGAIIKIDMNNNANTGQNTNPDSASYYRRILRQPDMVTKIDTTFLTGDSVAFAINETTAGLYFPKQLQVKYLLADEDPLYLRQNFQNRPPVKQTSTLTLVKDKPIEVLANGAYFEPLDILSGGYWSWSDKMANMLPFDFKPKPIAIK